MFNKTIFKQTLKANYVLWLIFTIVTSAVSALIIAVYDPKMMTSMTSMLEDSAMADMIGDRLETATSILGMLGSSFYVMIGVILPLIYIIITANSLVASQVDRGSMAYTLSAPIKRSQVVGTQAIYLICAILAMVGVTVGVGLTTAQVAHGGVFSVAHTADVKEVSQYLDVSEEKLETNHYLIAADNQAIEKGAKAREIDKDVYQAYLTQKMTNEALESAANKLGKEVKDVKNDPSLILADESALKAGAKKMGVEVAQYQGLLTQQVAQKENSQQLKDMQDKVLTGMAAAAKSMDLETDELQDKLGDLKEDSKALAAAEEASGLPQEQFVVAINQQLGNIELGLDDGFDFDVQEYLVLNLGLFLLLFALSSISFAASSIFNLTKYAMMFGAGIPIAFFLFKILAETSEQLENLKYLSLNSLFDATAIITNQGYVLNFIVLGVVGVLLYILGLEWFKKKDLPL